MSGWICSYRSIWKHPFFKGNGMRVAVWHWLLHHAAWKETSQRFGHVKVRVERGEVCFSQQQIQDDTGATRRQVRDVLDWLIGAGKASKIEANGRANEGARVRANAKTILRIEKYDEYQKRDGQEANGAANEGATEGPTKEQDNNITILEPKGSLSAKADDKAEIAAAVLLFKEVASQQGWPTIKKLSKQRIAALRSRLRECGGVDGWRDALRRASASTHLNGGNDRGWVCNFDFITRQSSFTKLMEGNYDNRDCNAGQPNGGTGRPGAGMAQAFVAVAERRSRSSEASSGGGGLPF